MHFTDLPVPIYTDTPAADGNGPTFSPERCGLSCGCGLPSTRTHGELLRLLSQPTPTRSRPVRLTPSGSVHHLLTLDLARTFRRP